MKRILACLLALPMLAEAQSLGDAAKKERERRAKVKDSGAAKTVTDEELVTNKGSLANDAKPVAAEKTAARQPAGGVTAALETDAPVSRESAEAGKESYWKTQAQQARARIEQARSRYDAVQRMLRFGSGHRDADGNLVIYSNQQLKVMGDKAEAELKAAEAAFERLVDDGRRAGALPGWFR